MAGKVSLLVLIRFQLAFLVGSSVQTGKVAPTTIATIEDRMTGGTKQEIVTSGGTFADGTAKVTKMTATMRMCRSSGSTLADTTALLMMVIS